MMHENCKKWKWNQVDVRPCGTKWNQVYKTFAQQGDLDGFRRALSLNIPLCKGCYSAAAREGQMNIIMFMHDNRIEWDDDACIAATEGGHLRALTFAHEKGRIKLTSEIATISAIEGHADCLEYYIRKQGPRPSFFIIKHAAKGGHLSCLDLIIRNSYIIEPHTYSAIDSLVHEYTQPDRQTTGIMCQMAANTALAWGQVECFHYALRNCPMTDPFLERGMPLLYQRCCHLGNLSALKILHQFETNQMKRAASWTVTSCSTAASNDNFDCLYFARESGCPWDESTCACASLSNSVRCLSYALERRCPFDGRMLINAVVREHMDCIYLAVQGFGAKVSESALKIAVRSDNDNVEVLSLLIDHFIRDQKEEEFYKELLDEMIHTASYRKNSACLEYLLNRFGLPQEDVYGRVCANAASKGSLKTLKLARSMGCAWTAETCASACMSCECSEEDSEACLKYAHEQGCPWDERTTANAVVSGKYGCLKYALQHGCPVSPLTLIDAVRKGEDRGVEYLDLLRETGLPWPDPVGIWAAALLNNNGDDHDHDGEDEEHTKRNVKDTLRYVELHGPAPPANAIQFVRNMRGLDALRRRGYTVWTPGTFPDAIRTVQERCIRAIIDGNLPLLIRLRQGGAMFSDAALTMHAAGWGHLKLLQYLCDEGCPVDEDVAYNSVKYNRLDCFEYLRSISCPWDHRVCCDAAKNNDLVILRYAHENGCPWSEHVCTIAAEERSWRCLLYSQKHGCPWNGDVLKNVQSCGNTYILSHLVASGVGIQSLSLDEKFWIVKRRIVLYRIIRVVFRVRAYKARRMDMACRTIQRAWNEYNYAPSGDRAGYNRCVKQWYDMNINV